MDEKGFLIGILSKQKRIFSREQYTSGKIRSLLQDGNREWITVLAAICADGTALSPSLIYQAASGNIQDTWLQDFDPDQHRSFFTSSPTGWTSHDIGLAWLEQVFDRETKEKVLKARRAYRLLVLDGHGSHVTMKFFEYCDANKILLAIFPPRSTHTLQPLDVVMFSPLAAAYSAELAQYLDMCQGLSSITKRDFYRFFYAAWSRSFTEKNIRKAFESTGLEPFDPQVILQRVATKDHSRPSSSGSTASVLSASDWRKIERLLREVIANTFNEQARKLSHTIHAITVQKTLLQHENDRLKEALINERKRRQRGKALLLEPAEGYNGGAVFWSPSKVAAARDRQRQKDLDEELAQQQKSEATRQRDEQKQLKELEREQRRQQRQAAKEERAQLNAEKAAQRESTKMARQLKKQLQNDIQLSQIGNRGRPKPRAAPIAPVVRDIDVAAPVLPSAASTTTSRRGRPIKLPANFE